MSDSCYWQIVIPTCDVPKFNEFRDDQLEFDDEILREDGSLFVAEYEADSGHYKLNEELADAEIRFQGMHGSGSEYVETSFACWDGVIYEIASADSCPVIYFPSSLEDFMNYQIAYLAIDALSEGKPFEPTFVVPLGAAYSDTPLNELLEETRGLTRETPLTSWAPLIDRISRFNGDISVVEQYLLSVLVRAGMAQAAGFAAVRLATRQLALDTRHGKLEGLRFDLAASPSWTENTSIWPGEVHWDHVSGLYLAVPHAVIPEEEEAKVSTLRKVMDAAEATISERFSAEWE